MYRCIGAPKTNKGLADLRPLLAGDRYQFSVAIPRGRIRRIQMQLS